MTSAIYKEKVVKLDPRTQILLLIISNIVAFVQRSIYVETAFIIFLAILLVYCDCKKAAVKWIMFFSFLLVLQFYIFPAAPTIIRNMFSFLTLYARKVFPCIMAGTIIVKTTPVRYFILTLQKFKIPQQVIIPLSITMRYFPAIKEEVSNIRDAMKLRKLKGIAKIEYYIVPFMISATNTAEELSAAAVTRGIENPVTKTSLIKFRFKKQDYLCLAVGLTFDVLAVVIR